MSPGLRGNFGRAGTLAHATRDACLVLRIETLGGMRIALKGRATPAQGIALGIRSQERSQP